MRKNWMDYFMNFAVLASTRSGCHSRQVGCVIVKDNRIIATGYNAAPFGLMDCTNTGHCLRKNVKSGTNLNHCFAVHAEQNAITQCAKTGISCDGGTMYVTTHPCVHCMKMIINSGITKVVYMNDYDDELAKSIADKAGLIVQQYVL